MLVTLKNNCEFLFFCEFEIGAKKKKGKSPPPGTATAAGQEQQEQGMMSDDDAFVIVHPVERDGLTQENDEEDTLDDILKHQGYVPGTGLGLNEVDELGKMLVGRLMDGFSLDTMFHSDEYTVLSTSFLASVQSRGFTRGISFARTANAFMQGDVCFGCNVPRNLKEQCKSCGAVFCGYRCASEHARDKCACEEVKILRASYVEASSDGQAPATKEGRAIRIGQRDVQRPIRSDEPSRAHPHTGGNQGSL